MPASSPRWSEKLPQATLRLKPSPLLCAYFLCLGALAAACCIFLLPTEGVIGALRWLVAAASLAYGAWLAAEHGLRLGRRALAAVTLLPDGTLCVALGRGDAVVRICEVHRVATALLSFSWREESGRTVCALIPADAMQHEHHRRLRAALLCWNSLNR